MLGVLSALRDGKELSAEVQLSLSELAILLPL